MQNLGPYTILEVLGRGGQGVVYLAEDTRLKRRVALKVLGGGGVTPDRAQLERFRREAEAASKLDHPNICGIHEAGEAGGVPYLAMRFVEGETLADAIETAKEPDNTGSTSTPQSRDQIHAVLARIEKCARALHVAHERGLIHRDIKPGNIMVTAEGEPVVLDFGLARDEESADHSLTHSGDLLGTPAYMSPEQLMAQRIPLDRRTDVYSLGATLYECLTLRRPFEATTRAELYQRIMTHEASSATSHNRAIPVDLRVVIATAIEKDRNRRYQTALAFAEDLRRVRQFEPIQAKPIGTLLRLRRWAQRHPALSVAAVLLVAGLAVATTLAISLAQSLGRTERIKLANAARVALDSEPQAALKLALRAVAPEPGGDNPPEIRAALAAVLAAPEMVRTVEANRFNEDVDVSPDYRRFALASNYPSLSARVVELETGASYDLAHEQQVASIQFHPGQPARLLTASVDGHARLWSLETRSVEQKYGGRPRTSEDPAPPLVRAVFTPDGAHVVTVTGAPRGARAAGPHALRVFDTTSGAVRHSVPLPDRAQWLCVHPAAATALVACVDTVLTVDLDRGAILDAAWQPHGTGSVIAMVEYSANGEHVATTGFTDRLVRVWTADERKRQLSLPHDAATYSACFSRDGDAILTTASDGVRLFDRRGFLTAIARGHGTVVPDASFLDDSTRFVAATHDGTAIVWDAAPSDLPFLPHTDGLSTRCTFSPDGESLVLASTTELLVWRWDASPRTAREIGSNGWASATWLPSGGMIESSFTQRGDTSLDYYDAERVRRRSWPLTSGQRGLRLASSPVGTRFAMVSPMSGDVLLFDIASDWERRRTVGGIPAAACFTASGEVLAVATQHRGVQQYWTDDLEPAGPGFAPVGSLFWDVEVYHDAELGDVAAAAGDAGIVYVWRLADGRELARIEGHGARVEWVGFSPDGRTVLSSSRIEGVTRIVDWRTGQIVFAVPFGGPTGFHPDGDKVVIAGRDGVRVWPVDFREHVRIAERRSGQDPWTAADWQRYEELLK